MKNYTIILIMFLCLIGCSYPSDKNKYDFSKITTKAELDSLFSIIKKDSTKFTYEEFLQELKGKGMHYDGVPLKSARISHEGVVLYTDTTDYSGKKMLEKIEAQDGFGKLEEFSGYKFTWNSELQYKNLSLELVNGEHLASLGEKDYAELSIEYKPIYTVPIANIHKELEPIENKQSYVFDIYSNNYSYDVYLNDINISKGTKSITLNLNNYILNNNACMLKVIAEPLGKESHFSANLKVKNTDKVLHKFYFKNKKEQVVYEFTPSLPIYPDGWSKGVDLRNDPKLKEKIIALYAKLGEAFLNKDEKMLNDLLYTYRKEKQMVNYKTDYDTARNYWSSLLEDINRIYRYTVNKDFDIEFNDNGRLIYAYPKDNTDMLILTGKEYSAEENFYLYQPEGSNELKIIR